MFCIADIFYSDVELAILDRKLRFKGEVVMDSFITGAYREKIKSTY